MLSDRIKSRLTEANMKIAAIVNDLVTTSNASPAPSTIYHYTNDVGLAEILKTGKLWLNDIFSLNDPKEVQHGYETALHLLLTEADTRGVKAAIRAARHLIEMTAWQGLRGSAQMFALSFSAAGDDLGQWRAYADDGRGFALGFDGALLDKQFSEQENVNENRTFNVIYSQLALEAVQRAIAKAYVDFVDLVSADGDDPDDWEFRQTATALFGNAAIHASLLFKHQGYENEREFRFLRVLPSDHQVADLKIRRRSYKLIKYLEHDWKEREPLLLREIIVGPAQTQQAQRFAVDCLDVYHTPYRGRVSLQQSQIPYQGR